jgi:hypothetical protein
MGKDQNFHLELNLNFNQILNLLGQLTDEQKIEIWKALKIDLEKKGVLKWAKNEKGGMLNLPIISKEQEKKYKNPLVTIDMMRDWESDLPEEDEQEMTDEEYLKAIEEMS